MSWLDKLLTLPVTSDELRDGRLLLQEIRALCSLNAILFDHLRASLVPGGVACALPRNTHVQAGKQAQSDGRVLELYMGMLFHCMGFTVLSCGGGPADGGVDVKVEDSKGDVIAIQCKQYSRAVVGYNVGLQLIGAMYTTGASVGVLITPSTASQDVKTLARSMQDVREGELQLHLWEGEQLVRLLGRWSADILDTRAALMEDVLGDVGLCDRIMASQRRGYCIRHAICLPRGDGECDKNCSSVSQPVHGRPAVQLSPSLGYPSFVRPSRMETITSCSSTCADKDDAVDSAAALESISSDDDEDDMSNILTNQRDGGAQLSPVVCHRPRSSPSRQATPMSVSRSTHVWPHVSVLQTPGSTAAKHRHAVLWTEEEEDELHRCVVLMGEGRWTEIVEASVMLRTRGKTAMKIRDKWKNMRKRQLRPCNQTSHNQPHLCS